ncbi:hypothetical protein NDU88_002519 [Pleurodeles waltl]|uniref:Reverse transcriptase domain-containing protein n=1 Tax=Pleurodeles waltl TaxID=8319 RepID=A0AAV7Q684_PLEWA|nr:hypothetical protein NDU88_002519 [Pleurodeles waltl]
MKHPQIREYSFYSAPHKVHTRIDLFWGTQEICTGVSGTDYLAKTLSDHSPLSITLDWGRRRHAIPMWRLQVEALHDPAFIDALRTALKQYWESNTGTTNLRATEWDAHKVVIRGHCISTTWGVRRTLHAEVSKLEEKLRALENAVACNVTPYSALRETRAEHAKADATLRLHDHKHHMARLQAEGDRSGRLLAWLLREDRRCPPIGSIITGVGAIATTQVNINDAFREYYTQLYTKSTSCTIQQLESFLADSPLPQLTNTDRESLEAPITLGELNKALEQLPRNKVPGTDGLPSEYYSTFATHLNTYLLKIFEEAEVNGNLPPSMREAMIVVLPKPGRDPTDVRSYRPLSLLNLDCKILGKILANRLAPYMHILVHEDQNGFIPKRSTFLNIRRLLSVMGDSLPTALEEAVISLDIEKAFDTLEWDFLFATMQLLGLGPKFINWVRILYTAPQARVKTGGVVSDAFSICRGTRQGCPLSPLLFALAMEPLAARVRAKKEEWGVSRNGTLHSISLYADDALIYVRRAEDALAPVMSLLSEFGRLSGLMVDWGKSCIFPLVSWPPVRQENVPTGHLKWCFHIFKYLGINVYHKPEDLRDGNLGRAVSSVKSSLCFWNKLPLSPLGKVAIANMLILPRLLYYFEALPITIPKSFFIGLNSILLQLVWGEGRRRVALTTLHHPVAMGGLGAPNFELYSAAAQLQWILYWLHRPSSAETIWLKSRLQDSPILTWLLDKQNKSTCTNPLMLTAHSYWKKYVQGGSKAFPYSPLLPLEWLPGWTDAGSFSPITWLEAGINEVGDCFEEGKLMTFEAIQALTGINRGQFLAYHAICHAIRKTWASVDSEPDITATLHHMLRCDSQVKAVSNLYKLLNKPPGDNLQKVREKWDSVLPNPVSESEWSKALSHTREVSRNPRFRYTQFNYLHQTYLAPARIKRMFPGSDPACPRCKKPAAQFYHMVWECPRLGGGWERVVKTLAEITGLNLNMDPRSCLLGLRPRTKRNKHSHRFVDLAYVIYKRLIAMSWKARNMPDLKVWLALTLRWARAEHQLLINLARRGLGRMGEEAWGVLVSRLEAKNDERPP